MTIAKATQLIPGKQIQKVNFQVVFFGTCWRLCLQFKALLAVQFSIIGNSKQPKHKSQIRFATRGIRVDLPFSCQYQDSTASQLPLFFFGGVSSGGLAITIKIEFMLIVEYYLKMLWFNSPANPSHSVPLWPSKEWSNLKSFLMSPLVMNQNLVAASCRWRLLKHLKCHIFLLFLRLPWLLAAPQSWVWIHFVRKEA